VREKNDLVQQKTERNGQTRKVEAETATEIKHNKEK
jgi:hypothetical protein